MTLKISPFDMRKISELFEMAQNNKTLCNIFDKLDGTDAVEAYHVLSHLDDHELRVMAALIAQANRKFDRDKEEFAKCATM